MSAIDKGLKALTDWKWRAHNFHDLFWENVIIHVHFINKRCITFSEQNIYYYKKGDFELKQNFLLFPVLSRVSTILMHNMRHSKAYKYWL